MNKFSENMLLQEIYTIYLSSIFAGIKQDTTVTDWICNKTICHAAGSKQHIKSNSKRLAIAIAKFKDLETT